MWTSIWIPAELIVQIVIFILVMLYVKPYQKSIQIKEKAKFEDAAKSWALGAFTNLAIGIILLLVEKYFI